MMASLSARDRRALGVGLLAVVPIMGWSFGVQPYVGIVRDRGAALEHERNLLRRELALLAEAEAFPESMAAVARAASVHRARSFVSADHYAAGASFASLASNVAYDANVRIDRTDVHEPAAGRAGTELRVSLGGVTDVAGLIRYLRAIEDAGQAMIVERLSVRPLDDGMLDISLDLLAFGAASDGSS